MEIAFAVAELGRGMPADELAEMAGMALTAAKSQSTEAIPDTLDDLPL